MGHAATEDILSFKFLAGGAPISGFAPGQAVRFAKAGPDFAMRVGVAGMGSYTKINDSSGTLFLDLLPTSDGNDILTQLHRFMKNRENAALIAVSFVDGTGRFSCTTAGALIMKLPDTGTGDGSGINTWEFISLDWIRNVGGRGPTEVIQYADIKDLDIPIITPPEAGVATVRGANI